MAPVELNSLSPQPIPPIVTVSTETDTAGRQLKFTFAHL
jgi:hypothetical protein